jgi:hypothetical protein
MSGFAAGLRWGVLPRFTLPAHPGRRTKITGLDRRFLRQRNNARSTPDSDP